MTTTYPTPDLLDRLDAVEAHAAPQWLEAAAAALDELIASGRIFAASDVWTALGDDAPVTHEPRALGPLVQRASRDGRIVQVGTRKSERRSGGLEALWVAVADSPDDATDQLQVVRNGEVLHLYSRWTRGRVVWCGKWGDSTWQHETLEHVLRSWKRAITHPEPQETNP